MKSILFSALVVIGLAGRANGTFSMIEINPQHGAEQSVFSDSSKHVYGAGEFSNMIEYNGSLYFVAQDTIGNEELWTSDGTQQGTRMVKDINPNGSSQIGNIVIVDGKMLFMASDSGTNFDLYSSDGTAQGTVKINEANEAANDGLSADRSAVFGNKLLFCTNTALIGTDGTTGGTSTVLSIAQYAASPAQGYCELNGYAYFMLVDNLGNPELWKTDGTTQGTQPSLDFSTDSFHLSSIEKLFAFNGKIYVVGYAGGNGYDLFSVEGSGNGYLKKIQLNSNPLLGSNPYYFRIVNNELVFVASTGTGNRLFVMTDSDTIPQQVPSVMGIDVSSGLSFGNNSVYFLSSDMKQIHQVGLNGFNHHVIDLPGYYMPSYALGDGSFLVGTGDKIFFAAYDSTNGKQVFMESNGTAEGTFATMPAGANTDHPFNQILSCGAIDGFDFFMWGSKVVLPANFNNAGRELWFYNADGLVNGIQTVKNNNDVQIFPNPVLSKLNFKTDNAGGYCETNVRVTDMNGQVVLRQTVTSETASIDVSSLAAGNYCISFSSASNLVTVKKFVVVK